MASQTRRALLGTALVFACGVRPAIARAGKPLLDIPLGKDAAGRLLAPVYVNGHGPFRFMLDSGASHCAVPRDLARRLALAPASTGTMSIDSTTGRSSTQAVAVDSLEVGSLRIERMSMPVIDAAEGIIGANALIGTRLDVNFDTRRIVLSGGADQTAPDTRTAIPLQQRFGGLLLASGKIGTLDCSFIIDTGAQRTIGNPALAQRLNMSAAARAADPLIVATPDAAIAATLTLPALPIAIGAGAATTMRIACADLPVFALWQLTEQPAVLLGMDYFSRCARFVIDYRHSTLALRSR